MVLKLVKLIHPILNCGASSTVFLLRCMYIWFTLHSGYDCDDLLDVTELTPDGNIVVALLREARDIDTLSEQDTVGRSTEMEHSD
jgi:hypothetical protein